MFDKVKDLNKKMKMAKELIVNGSKIIPLIKIKAEDLFKYNQTVKVNKGLVEITLNGKFECVNLEVNKELMKSEPEKAIELIKQAISSSNQGMLEHILSEAKELGKEVDPKLLGEISESLEEEIKEQKNK